MNTVTLTTTKQHAFLKGHPWIYPKAIAKYHDNCQNGTLVRVLNSDNTLVATGVFNANSLYRVRILAYAYEPMDIHSLESIIEYRLKQACLIRQQLGLPNAQTTAYRLFNSEADGLSGLTIDRFNQICVVASSALWVEKNQALIQHCIKKIMPLDEILWLSQEKSLKQDGWLSDLETFSYQHSEQVLEAGIRYQVNFENIQKTGLFLDQRENHQRIAQLAQGKNVLDLYSYTGGFALHAAKSNARKVTAVDSSAAAIELAKQNAALNQIDSIEFITADAREYLAQCGEYDLVILDPPKLAPSIKHIERAKNYYRFLHREAFKHMKPGTLVMTCNCSSALSSSHFNELVNAQASAVNKVARTLGIYGPASCHPTLPGFPEGHYLTAILLAIV